MYHRAVCFFSPLAEHTIYRIALPAHSPLHDLRRHHHRPQPGDDQSPWSRRALPYRGDGGLRPGPRPGQRGNHSLGHHSKVAGNKRPDEFAKAAAKRVAPCSDENVVDELLTQASLSYMSRSATEARSRSSAELIASHARTERRYRPPPGCGLCRQHLRNTRGWSGGTISPSSAIDLSGRTFKDKLHKVDSDRCWWAWHHDRGRERLHTRQGPLEPPANDVRAEAPRQARRWPGT